MKILDVNHYVKRLKEKFPEVSEKSIKNIIDIGNRAVTKHIKKSTRKKVVLTGHSLVNNKYRTFMVYRQNSIAYDNKLTINKRIQDAKKDKENDK